MTLRVIQADCAGEYKTILQLVTVLTHGKRELMRLCNPASRMESS